MGEVIIFDKYIRKREKEKMCQRVVTEIKETREKGMVYRVEDMEGIVDKILYEIKFDGDNENIVPVVEIARQMCFSTFQQKMGWWISGYIRIDKKYEKLYKTDHIICTSQKVHPYQQRFVIAHELAHFLFDYDHKSPIFRDNYKKNNHSSESETRANTFAANLLMPKEKFIVEYNKARKQQPDPIFLTMHLSELFKSPRKAIIKRIQEVIN